MSEKNPETHSIENLRKEIDDCDEAILAYVKRRTEISREIGKIRAADGGPRIVPAREAQIHEYYSSLGPEGSELVDILLRLGRGPSSDAWTHL